MIKNNNLDKKLMIIVIIIIIIIFLINYLFSNKQLDENDIANLTDLWIIEVTKNNNPESIYKLFCQDGNLIGTASQIKRTGNDIKLYFNYFAKLPGLKVISREYNISKVTSNVYINSAFIKWQWDGLIEPVSARMTFTYRDKCIFQLHSSVLPDRNKNLYEISNMF